MRVSLDGDYALIGAHGHGLSGAAYIFERSGTTWSQQQKLTASDSSRVSYFGQHVALYGEYAVVSDHYAGDFGDQKGAAWVFKRSGSTWTQQQKLTASDGAHGDRFGRSVSLFGDYAIIGAEEENDGQGAAYVFKRYGSSWTQQQKLTASDGGSDNFFGDSVSISEDYALVGSPNNFAGIRKGAAYIFTRSGSTWTQLQKLVASDASNYKYFGESVSLSAEFALVGTKYHEQAYVFELSGSSWTEKYKLSATDNENGDGFGSASSVCISGNDVIIGSIEDDGSTGSAYFFAIPSSPSPPPPPPPEQPESTDTSQNCKCSCCAGNYCSASIVASYDAESSSDCGAADCRSRFSTLCPASGESGSVSASYSQSTTDSSSTTPAAATPTSDAQSIKVMHSLAAAVGISLMLAY